MRPRAWLVTALSALVFMSAAGSTASRNAPGGRLYDPSRDPARDLSAAVAEAKQDQKRILLEVGGNWCGWCREFARFASTDAAVHDALQSAFVVVPVNVSPENPNTRFLSAYPEIPGYPYLFVLDESGTLLASADSDDFLEGETYDPARFLAFLRKWARAQPKKAGN